MKKFNKDVVKGGGVASWNQVVHKVPPHPEIGAIAGN